MSGIDLGNPATWPRHAWDWYLTGYRRGVQSGITMGYAEGHVDGAFAEATRKGPVVHVADEIDAAFAHVRAQREARRAENAPPKLTAEQIKAQAATSWAEVEARIGGAA